MNKKIQLLDCTLRDGAYIVDGKFGTSGIRGIIKKLQEADIDVIECGWLKDSLYKTGTTYYHVPSDLEPYLPEKKQHTKYVAMMDWDRYDLKNLPQYDGKSIDAIRVVFPQTKFKEGIRLGETIKKQGYEVYFQAANTLGYSEDELIELAKEVNETKPKAVSIVDTFGAMYSDDLLRIVEILDKYLDKDILLGFHSHNNQQLSFALTMKFVELVADTSRNCVVDASLCGMGRGAGNATTELMANYLNRKQNANYDMNAVMDAIDMYMEKYMSEYSWGYSIPYFIAGMYCTHVNNIAYLLKNHRTNAKDMRNIIESLSPEDRKKYNYDLLEETYLDYQDREIDDSGSLEILKDSLKEKKVLLLFPGKSIWEEKEKIERYITENHPIVIGVNAIQKEYNYDYLFFSNKVRYTYAKDIHKKVFETTEKIVSSSVKTFPVEKEFLVNFNRLVKRGYEHFDNAGIMCLRLLNKIQVKSVILAGFDGFEGEHSKNYADVAIPYINPGKTWESLNEEIRDMLREFRTGNDMQIEFLTSSKYE